MITLDSTVKKLEVYLAGAVSLTELPITAMWTDWNTSAGTQTLASGDAHTTGTSPVQVVAAPGSGVSRVINLLTVYNADTGSATATVRLNDNGTAYPLITQTLSPGQNLLYTRQGGWQGPGPFAVNVTQLAGTAASVNSGTKDAGTQRVVLATDQPALTNKLLVTPDSVALPSNQSVNISQMAGTATSMNSGTKDAGTQRVVLATDQPALTNKLLVTPDSVALPSHQSVNLDQWNGVSPAAAVALAEGVSNPTAPLVGACGLHWNGSGWDREAAGITAVALSLAARTTAQTVTGLKSYGCKGLGLILYMSVSGGTGGLSPFVSVLEPSSGVYVQIVPTPTAVTGTGYYNYTLYPGASLSLSGITTWSMPLIGETFSINVAVGNANSYTYSLSYTLLR